MPQHVEPLTPIATREVVGIRVPPLPKAPERPARVSKGGRAAAMPVSARAPVVAPVAPEPVPARMALGVSSESMSAAAKNLRDKGRMKKVAGPGRGWLELAR
jgi:hypothetical protein